MRTKQTIRTSAFLCLLLGPIIAGCAGATPTPEPVAITFVHPDFDTEYYETLVAEFNESYPYITVELRSQTGSIINELGGGHVDVFAASPYALIQLRGQGDILSLDPFIERDQSFNLPDFYPGVVELLTIEGKTWAVPAGIDVAVMFYSQDLFDQYGVPYPEIGWTWNDFLEAGLAISDPDAGIYGYTTTGTVTDPGYPEVPFFIYQHGGRLFDSLRNPTYTTFDDPLTIQAVEWYARLFHEYDVAPTPSEARRAFGGNQYAVFDGLRHGKVGMWIGMLSERGGMTWPVEWFVNWGMVPLPRDAQAITQADVEGYAIYAQTEHPDACWQWITFLSQRIPYRLMPARKSLAESTAYGQLVGEDVAIVARASMENAVLINLIAFAEFEDDMGVLAEAVGEVIDENMTPEEAMEWAQRRAEQ
jgi:ABC-type glycerol-3-phosphate transport system substrate-binding protein